MLSRSFLLIKVEFLLVEFNQFSNKVLCSSTEVAEETSAMFEIFALKGRVGARRVSKIN